MKIKLIAFIFLIISYCQGFGQTKEDSCYACGAEEFCEDIIENNDCNNEWQFLNNFYGLNNLNEKIKLADTYNKLTRSKMIFFDLSDTITQNKEKRNVSNEIIKELKYYNKIRYARISIITNWERENIANELFNLFVQELSPNNGLEYLFLRTSGNINSSIFKFKKLKKLHLQFTTQSEEKTILDFPQKLDNEVELLSLKVDMYNHSGITEKIYSLNKLENLELNYNAYEHENSTIILPNGISKLSKLITLRLSKITKLPVDIGGLFNLEKIELTGNISTIPETWNQMKLLESINVAGCINLDSSAYQQIFRSNNLKNLKINVKGLKYLSNPIENCRFNVIYVGGNSINLNELAFIQSLKNISIDSNYTLTDISIVNKLNIKKIKIHDVPIDSALCNLENDNNTIEELLIDNISFLLLNKKSIKKLKALKKIIVYDAYTNYKNGSQKTAKRLNRKAAEISIKKNKYKHLSSYSYLKLKAIKEIKKSNKNIEITFISQNI